jgi:hypothetical protein
MGLCCRRWWTKQVRLIRTLSGVVNIKIRCCMEVEKFKLYSDLGRPQSREYLSKTRNSFVCVYHFSSSWWVIRPMYSINVWFFPLKHGGRIQDVDGKIGIAGLQQKVKLQLDRVHVCTVPHAHTPRVLNWAPLDIIRRRSSSRFLKNLGYFALCSQGRKTIEARG